MGGIPFGVSESGSLRKKFALGPLENIVLTPRHLGPLRGALTTLLGLTRLGETGRDWERGWDRWVASGPASVTSVLRRPTALPGRTLPEA